MRILKLPKTIPVGSLIYRLKASAAQDSPINFVIANGTDVQLISIKSVGFYQANVYLNKPLQENEYNFTIYVTDGIERTHVDCQIIVYNGTQLMTSSFIHFRPLLSIPESASFNSTIGYIHVKEKDNSNLPVTFEIEGSNCFGIRYIFGPKGTSKAEIYLKTQLDFERQNLFRLKVYALNAWTNEEFDTRNIVMKELIITVINEQDTPPEFRQLPHLVQLSETTTPGDVVLTLYAVDGDQEQNRKITYHFKEDDVLQSHFYVDANTGEVVLKSTIDSLREYVGQENLFTLTFVAKEVDQEFLDSIGKKTDNSFEHYSSNLSDDLDLPNELDTHNHYIVNENFYEDEDNFNSSPVSDLLAIDSHQTKTDNLEQDKKILENVLPLKSTPINIPPLKVKSFDQKNKIIFKNENSGNNSLNSLIAKPKNEYSNLKLLNNTKHSDSNLIKDDLIAEENFIVNNLTSIGLMDMRNMNSYATDNPNVLSRLNDRNEMFNAVLNTLKSSSKSETEVNVAFIILQNLNHAPNFIFTNQTNDYILNGQIEDNAKISTLVRFDEDLTIEDQDHGLNGTFDIQLIDSYNIFDVQPKTGYRNQKIQIILKENLQPYSLDNKKINLKIIVTDKSASKPLKTELTLSIFIIDTNDNFPQFTKDIFKTSFNEKEQIGTVITRISATDLDSGDYGKITYSHLLGEIASNLAFNPVTGEITLVSLDKIDREKKSFYTLIIYICDNLCIPGESNSNQTLLEIQILDFNDNPPEFSVSRYDYLLNTDLFTFTSPIRVIATDADEPNTSNSNITYEIISGNLQSKFKINELTGEIVLLSPLQLEGHEDLPITDLENGLNTEKINEDIAKNRLVEYPWSEDNFDLIHLDSKFSYYSPIINLTVRAHDQGIPILDNFINVFIHCQNYINRTVVFLANESENVVKRKKNEYERYLSEMSSGRVRIKSINAFNYSPLSSPNRTLIYSTVTYPSQSIINVNKVNWFSAKLINAPPNMLNVPAGAWSWLNNNLTGLNRQGRNQLDVQSVKTASFGDSFIFWLLIVIIIITFIFLLILIAIWFYFCSCKKRKNKINSADSNKFYDHYYKQQHANRQLLKNQLLENDSIDSQTNIIPSNNDYNANNQKKNLKHYIKQQRNNDPDDYQMTEFDAAAFASKYKKRSKPGSAVYDNAGYFSDTDPSGNFILTRKPRSAPDSHDRRKPYVDKTGVFMSNKRNFDKGYDYYPSNENQKEFNNGDIANEDAYSILNRVWFGDRNDLKKLNQPIKLIEDSENATYASIVKRNKVKFTDETVSLDEVSSNTSNADDKNESQSEETEVKQLHENNNTASQSTLQSQPDQLDVRNLKENNQQYIAPVQIDTQNISSKIPKAILKNNDKNKFSKNVSPSSDTDSGIGHNQLKENSNNQTTNQAPNLPSPLTSQQLQLVSQKLHLKNEDVAQKKSVFTIAYNGIKTNRLNSADSRTVFI